MKKIIFSSLALGTLTMGLAVSSFAMPIGNPTTVSQASTIPAGGTDHIMFNKGGLVVGGVYNVNCTLTVADANGAYAKIDELNLDGSTLTIDGGTITTGAQQDITTGAHLMLVANATIASASTPEVLTIHNLDGTASIDVSACEATPVV